MRDTTRGDRDRTVSLYPLPQLNAVVGKHGIQGLDAALMRTCSAQRSHSHVPVSYVLACAPHFSQGA